jgi:hypothetical protein
MSEYETHHEPAPRESGFHRVSVGHLVMGTAFLGLTVVWLLVVGLDLVDLDDAHWLMPLPWLVAGAVGLAATALRGRFPAADRRTDRAD